MRWPPLRRLTISAGERTVPGAWTIIACRKRFIDDKLADGLSDIDAVVILGSGMDTRGFRLARRSDIPVFEVDLPVNIASKKAAVQRALTTIPNSVHLVGAGLRARRPHWHADRARVPHRYPHVLHLGGRHAVSDRGRRSHHARRTAGRPRRKQAGLHLCPPRLHRRHQHVRREDLVQALQAAAAGVEVRPRARRNRRIRRHIRLATGRTGRSRVLPEALHSDRPGAISPPPIWSGRRTARSVDP